MTFSVVTPRTATFGSFDDLFHFANDEAQRTIRVPLKGFLEQGARVSEDTGIGFGNTLYRFNADSFDALCNLSGASPEFLKGLKAAGLASDVLNDVLRSGRLRRDMESLEMICDEDNKQVIGFVSSRYRAYSNKSFLADVLRSIDTVANEAVLFPSLGKFKFKEGHSYNTRMYLRLHSELTGGVVRGRGGWGEDLSEIGLQAFNSMAGGQAVRFSYFVHRLVCANGLTAPVAGGAGRVTHTGKPQAFAEKLQEATDQVLKGLGNAARMIEKLGELTFDSRKLARHLDPKDLFSVTGDKELRKNCECRVPASALSDIKDPVVRRREHTALAIEEIPQVSGTEEARSVFGSMWRDNANMWDFVNVFTAHAKTQPLAQRLKTEERAGAIADWIARNHRKFS